MKYFKSICFALLTIPCLSFGFQQQQQQGDTLRFAVVTDTHIGKSGNNKGLAAIVEDINQNPEIDFVLHAGDVSDFGTASQLADAKNLMEGLTKPYYIVPGNHDTGWSDSGGLTYNVHWKDQKFLADIGGVRFIGVSTGPYGRMSRGYVPLDQMRWLDSLVMVTPKDQRVVFLTHYPLDEGLSNYYQLIEKLRELNTVAVFVGHGHVNKVFNFGGITGVMTRTAQSRKGTFAYNTVTLTPDSVLVKMVDVGQPANPLWASLRLRGNTERPPFSAPESDAAPVRKEHQDVKAVWTYQDRGNIVASPAIWKNSVLIGNLLGEFKSLDVETAKVNWQFRAGQSIYSTADVAGNRVVFGAADSTIYCLNAKTGSLLWKVKTGAPVLASPVIDNKRVYIGSSDLKFRAIDLASGKVIWTYEGLAGFPPSKPAVGEGKVVFGTWNKTLYALNTKDGSLAWEWKNNDYSHYYSPAMSIPVIQNGKVYMVAPDEKLREFDLKTGEQTFVSDRFRVRESLGGKSSKNWLVAKTMQDTIVAWSTKKGQPEPIFKISGEFGRDFSHSAPAFDDRTTFFFGTTFGRVYAVDIEAKQVKWIYQLSEDMVNTVKPLKNGAGVLATSADGKIVLLRGS
ncbi:PQQ-binding-like beta-propeller repeat protein [Cesiribacter sp. SM1]|uniref:outer membrane protein assembly factor BamB family protein n=1 Tax=Cesiribacter sp. SM1 TaxID=2861196 RepID=UPI001CD760F0|nr:PQQ-binding-like beta-propeller repeat protein [Cesiribacter sp. SM1]